MSSVGMSIVTKAFISGRMQQSRELLYKIISMFISLHFSRHNFSIKLLSCHFIHKTTASTKHPVLYIHMLRTSAHALCKPSP
jgi:hypothetical protein